MQVSRENIMNLLEYVQIDSFSVECHFKCHTTNKSIVSTVPFEPYEGKIELSWKEILLSPIKSYNRYYHTPITIYGGDSYETIVIKAYNRVANHLQCQA